MRRHMVSVRRREENRTEFICIRSGESEVEVTNNRRLRSIVLLNLKELLVLTAIYCSVAYDNS